MKNKGIFLLGTLMFTIFLFPIKVFGATTGYIKSDFIQILKDPTIKMSGTVCGGSPKTNYIIPGVFHCLSTGDPIEIIDTQKIPGNNCSDGYYKMKYTYNIAPRIGESYEGYVCSNNVELNVDTSKYKSEFAEFPESYHAGLTILKNAHPNWIFTAKKTNTDWNTAITNESNVEYDSRKKIYWSRSYIQTTKELYLSRQKGSYDLASNKYNQMEAGGWYAANKETVAYYMDPRNFLDAGNIFMFENLGYNSNYQTEDVVNKIFAGTDLLPYSSTYIKAGETSKISPVLLAARSFQEVLQNGKLTRPANGEGKIGETTYYNVYSLGANSSCPNPQQCAIEFAAGISGSTAYNRPWTSIESAILNGAEYIANNYVKGGQDTLYFQRWDVLNGGKYSWQYMTNVSAPLSEGTKTQLAYNEIPNLLNNTIEFIIPVYENMPNNAVALPTDIVTDKASIKDLVAALGYNYNSGYISSIPIGTTISSIRDTLIKNGATIKVTPSSSRDGDIVGTGDLFEITLGESTEQLRLVINGDANGDGKVNASDYVAIRNHIMDGPKLTGSYYLAADVDSNGSIGSADYVNVKNYIMGNPSNLR